MTCGKEHKTWQECLTDQVDEVYANIGDHAPSLPEPLRTHLRILSDDAEKYTRPSMEAPVAVIAARHAIDATLLAVHLYPGVRRSEDPSELKLGDLRSIVAEQPGVETDDVDLALWACLRRDYIRVDESSPDSSVKSGLTSADAR